MCLGNAGHLPSGTAPLIWTMVLQACTRAHWQTGLAKAHQASLPARQLGFRLKETFLVTGSQDCTVKLWPIPKVLLSKGIAPDSGPVLLQAQATQRCHDKVSIRVALWRGPHWDGYLSCYLLPSLGHQQCSCCSQ